MQFDDAAAPRTVDDLLARGRTILRAPSPGSDLDLDPREAIYLLAHVTGRSEARLRAFGEREVDPADAARYLDLVQRRAGGEPAAYLTGRREFYGRDFLVDPRVLVPRPETEHLVESVLELDLRAEPGRPLRLLDVGTGSGCIAVTLALELTDGARIVATDLSADALDVARANALRLDADVRFVRADLTTALRLAAFDVVASNPPYVAHGARSTLSPEVTEHEPHLALFAPERGTAVLERLLAASRDLRPGAHLVLEIGHDQGEWLAERTRDLGHLELLHLLRDYGGRDRTAVLRRRS